MLLSDEVYNAAPAGEPERQHYFIEKLSVLFSAGNAGTHIRKYCIVTFGCQMNARDSEKLSGILSAIGLEECGDERDADIVVFNTCTIRENANNHLYGRLGRLKQIQKQRPGMIIGVCGCMMQEADEIEKLRKKYPYVSIIFGTHNFHTFPELLFMCLRKHPVISVWKDSHDIIEELPNKRKFPFKQGINIMFGCNNFCSYCIVPYVRGREKSRTPDDIYAEILKSASEGVKEIMLLGQNVNSYSGGIDFPELLCNIDRITKGSGIERIRFMTSHPKDLSERLIDVMAESERICRQFHLPLQSGSDAILKRMNRHYDSETFIAKAEALKAAMPDMSLSTDIIVGFPGETEADFEDTLSVISRVRFDFAYTFIFSPREGTPAADYAERVPEPIVKERFDRLLKLQNQITAENLARAVGTVKPVLFENVSEYDEKLITGKLESGATVHVPGGAELIGSIRAVRLDECKGFYYKGSLF